MEILLVSPFFLSLLTLAQAHEEQKEKEEEEDPSSYVQGITVLGLLVLLIVLYRLLNAKREETREIAWTMLSRTISIFAGVVIYTVLDEVYKQLDVVMNHKKAPDDSYKMEVWLARLWVIVLYVFFVWSVSVKACIGQGKDYRMDIVKGGYRHTWCDYLMARLRVCSTAETSSCNERFEKMLKAAEEILLAEENCKIDHPASKECDAGKSSYKSTRCSITGSLFWAHALGFAGIDGWNMSQQQWCCLDDLNSEEKCKKHLPFADQIWWSFTLIMEQVGMYYVMFCVVGIFWSYVKVRFIEAKHFHLVKWEDGKKKRLTKRTEGSTDDDSWQWQEWTQEEEEEEEGEDEDCNDMEDMVVAFKKEPAGEGKVCYVEIRREGATEVCPWPRRGQTITTPTTPLVETPDSIPFDSPGLCECTYKAGEDDNGLPVYAVPVYDEIIERWDEFRKDGENDYFAMSTSFLLLQTLRLALTGTLPNKDEDEEVWKHSSQDSLKLAAFTLFCFLCAYKAYAVFVKAKKINFLQEASRTVKCMQYLGDIFLGVCVSVFFYLFDKNTTKPPKDFDLNLMIMSCLLALLFMVISGAFPNLSWSCPACLNVTERQGGTFARAVDILVNVFLLSASWSAMFATEWMLAHSSWSRGAKGKLVEGLLTINVAIWVTGVVFLSIWIVDLLLVFFPSGVFRLHETHEGAFAKISTSLGLLIGFVWESEFDKAVEHIADRIHDDTRKMMFKIGAGLGVLFFLLPVWFNSIIPMSEEHGYKFGFVFRRMHARFQIIHDEVVDEHKGSARSKQHKRHFSPHKEHVNEIIKFWQRILGGILNPSQAPAQVVEAEPTEHLIEFLEYHLEQQRSKLRSRNRVGQEESPRSIMPSKFESSSPSSITPSKFESSAGGRSPSPASTPRRSPRSLEFRRTSATDLMTSYDALDSYHNQSQLGEKCRAQLAVNAEELRQEKKTTSVLKNRDGASPSPEVQHRRVVLAAPDWSYMASPTSRSSSEPREDLLEAKWGRKRQQPASKPFDLRLDLGGEQSNSRSSLASELTGEERQQPISKYLDRRLNFGGEQSNSRSTLASAPTDEGVLEIEEGRKRQQPVSKQFDLRRDFGAEQWAESVRTIPAPRVFERRLDTPDEGFNTDDKLSPVSLAKEERRVMDSFEKLSDALQKLTYPPTDFGVV